ncbi:hypothetical protein [Halostagnicola sp. A-GB9-2]|uniref:hypothetical protein n=1 Tax=Halostagnicola sp. A-GB9-2 TaxID=3048066 RepID=UPI0024C05CF1|nr:hypothetical protein [Halostagnicola sp. A-GB9-2]MDJ1434710.1 hypothetical protein [Halostagnicola sp. A-GB9-2]
MTNEALREQLYVPVQTIDEVAVIDNDERDIVEQISVGSGPNGATAASVRPDSDATDAVMVLSRRSASSPVGTRRIVRGAVAVRRTKTADST